MSGAVIPRDIALGEMSMDGEFADEKQPTGKPGPFIPERPAELTAPRKETREPEVDSPELRAHREQEEIRKANDAAAEFIYEHRNDYARTPNNQERMLSYLEENGLSMTRASLEIAFEDLTAMGVLDKPTRKVQTGISDRSHRAPQRETLEDVTQKIHELPYEEARMLVQRTIRERSGR